MYTGTLVVVLVVRVNNNVDSRHGLPAIDNCIIDYVYRHCTISCGWNARICMRIDIKIDVVDPNEVRVDYIVSYDGEKMYVIIDKYRPNKWADKENENILFVKSYEVDDFHAALYLIETHCTNRK